MSMKSFALLLAVMAATSVAAVTAHANANRTFVSNTGLAGNTAQNCSAGSPCDTFANALSVTNAGGEINCLNNGDFGAVTINKAVTINCEGTSSGGISASGTNAIVVNTTSPVSLIGLDLNGLNATGGNGVFIQSNGPVNIRNCKIHNFLINFGLGTLNGAGILSQPTSSGGILVVDNVVAANNSVGIVLNVTAGGANMTVRNSNINNNETGISAQVSGGTHAGATIEQTTLAFNSVYGVLANGTGAVAVLGGDTVVNNATGVSNNGTAGVIYSFKNNQIGGNGTEGTPLTAYPGGPLN